MPTITRVQSLTAIAGLGLAVSACGDVDVKSDLNTEGPPRVITVTATSESFGETATYCADPTVERLNQYYCPTDPEDGTVPMLTDTLPIGWEARVVFNELLFASDAETLLPCVDGDHDGQCNNPDADFDDGVMHGSLIATQPVTISCGGQTIPYDGFYQPAGNHLTQTPGPSIVIQPLFPGGFAATGSVCDLTVRSDIRSKDEEMMTQAGPYQFQIAPMAVYETDPEDGAEIGVDGSIAILFNAFVDANSLSNIVVMDTTNNVEHPIVALDFDDVVVVLSANGAFDAGTSYELTVNTGVADIRGGEFTGPYTLSFTTSP